MLPSIVFPVSATLALLILIALAIPPLPGFRRQYRFSTRLRHRLRRGVQLSPRLSLWTLAFTLAVVGAGGAISSAVSPSAVVEASSDTSDGAVLARLTDYANAIGPETSKKSQSASLPDVDTMIARLAARLEGAPNDVRGWRMLGWSYFNTGAYVQSATAYERAAQLDPSSEEVKRLLAEARERIKDAEQPSTARASAAP